MSAWVEQATRTVCGGPHMGSPHTVLRLTTARVQPSRRGGQGRAGGGDNAPAALRGKAREVLFLPPKALRQLQNGVIQKIDLIMDTAAIRGRWVGVTCTYTRARGARVARIRLLFYSLNSLAIRVLYISSSV